MTQELPRRLLLPMLFAAASPAATPVPIDPTVVIASRAVEPMAATVLPAAPVTIEPAPQVGPYRLLEQIGSGGMGVVWLAEQTHPFPRRVALKMLRPDRVDARSLAFFEREVAALASIEHEHIARLHDTGVHEGAPWLAMELVPGEDLLGYADRRQLDTGARLQLFLDLADAVTFLHDRGLRHGDLKPDNILVVERNGRAVPKIIDLGLATRVGDAPVDDDALSGTPAYMAPEQFTLPGSALDERADVFALGVLLHELLTGARPWATPADRAANAIELTSTAQIRVDPHLNRSHRRILQRALAADRNQRHASVAELSRELRTAIASADRIRSWLRIGAAVAGAAITTFALTR
ncbi:MAG: serine/threonine protein kinase [Planctomycetes bacterium]|nr:serine/threonine protein kinase [Planctomycetota bacterium]